MFIGELVARLGVDTSQLKHANTQMQTFGTRATSTFSKVTKAAMSLKGAFIGLGGALAFRSVISSASEYESALIDMGKVTSQSFAEIDEQIKSMDSSLGNSIDLMKGYYQVISAGVTEPAQAQETLAASSRLAKVAHIEQSETVRALTKLMAGYRDELTDVVDAADLLIKTEKLGQTSVAELVPVIGDVANISNMAGLRAEEMAGALALITQTAGSTAEATTQLKALMRSVIKPTEEMTAIFSEFGSASEALQQLGLVEWLRRIEKAAGGAEGAAKMLGGRQESLIAFSALLAGNFEYLTNNIKELEDRTGTLDAAWADYRETFAAVWDEFKGQFKDFMIELGQTILPAITKAVQWLNEHFDTMVKTVKILTAVFLGWKIGKIAMSLFTMAEGSLAVASGLGLVKGALFGIAANPISWPLIAGLAVLAYWLKKTSELSETARQEMRKTYSVLGTGGGLLEDLPEPPAKGGEYDETSWRNETLFHQYGKEADTGPSVDWEAARDKWEALEEASAGYKEQLDQLSMSAKELELVKLDKWFEEQRKEIGLITPELQKLYDAMKKQIEGPSPGEGFQDTLLTFVKSVKEMSGQAQTAMKEFGLSASEAGETFSDSIIRKAEDAANYLVDEFDNPFMRTMFIDALEKLGEEGGGALYQAIADELKGVNDLVQGAADATVEARKKAEDIQLGFTPYTPEHTGHVSGTQRLVDERRAEEMNRMMALEESRKLKEKLDLMKQERFIELNPQAAGMFGGNEQGNQIGQSMGESIGQAMQDPITQAFQNVVSNMGSLDFTPVADSMRTSMEELSNEGQGVGDNIGQKINQGLVSQIKDAVEKAKSEINSLSTKVTITIRASTGSVSDSMREEL